MSYFPPSGMPVSTAQLTAINAASIIQIASATGINGATLASTNLTFGSGISLATHLPLFYVFKFASGTLGISVAKLKTAVADLTALSALLTVTSTQEVVVANSALVTFANSGNLTVEVTTASLGASTFNIYAYGIARV